MVPISQTHTECESCAVSREGGGFSLPPVAAPGPFSPFHISNFFAFSIPPSPLPVSRTKQRCRRGRGGRSRPPDFFFFGSRLAELTHLGSDRLRRAWKWKSAWRRPKNWEKIPKSLSNRAAGWKKRSVFFQLAELMKRAEAPKLNGLNPPN